MVNENHSREPGDRINRVTRDLSGEKLAKLVRFGRERLAGDRKLEAVARTFPAKCYSPLISISPLSLSFPHFRGKIIFKNILISIPNRSDKNSIFDPLLNPCINPPPRPYGRIENRPSMAAQCNIRPNIHIHLPPFSPRFRRRKMISKKEHGYFEPLR